VVVVVVVVVVVSAAAALVMQYQESHCAFSSTNVTTLSNQWKSGWV